MLRCKEDEVQLAQVFCASCNAALCEQCDAKIHTAARILAVRREGR